MAVLMNVEFQYGTSQTGIVSERENLKQPLIFKALQSWSYKDVLNKLNTIVITMLKKDVDLGQIYLERDAYIPAFDMNGIITAISDIDDTFLEITIHEQAWHLTRRMYNIKDEFKEYTISIAESENFNNLIQGVIDSANLDMPFNWKLGDDIPKQSEFEFEIKWKNHYEVLQLIALNSLNDIWFESQTVYIGRKGATVKIDSTDKLYQKLVSKIDLETYGNIVNIVGAKEGDINLHGQISNDEIDLNYNYERVVSNNNLTTQNSIDQVKNRMLKEHDSIRPDITLNISEEIINKYNLQSGDVIKINSNTETQEVKGFFRIIELNITDSQNTIKLQFSKDGTFLPRISDSLDILEAALIKIRDIEMNS